MLGSPTGSGGDALARMWARWKLGRALDKVERGKRGPKEEGVSSPSLTKLLKALDLSKQTALEAHRIGTLPEKEPNATHGPLLPPSWRTVSPRFRCRGVAETRVGNAPQDAAAREADDLGVARD